MKKAALPSILAAVVLLALGMIAEAQQPGKFPRIGFLSNRVKPTPTSPDLFENAFRQGLRDLGYIEGKSILVEYRYAEGVGDRLPGFAAELVQLKVDVLVSGTVAGIRAAKQATKTIPIVMMITGDPVALGLIDSLAHPGGNITGLTRLTKDLIGKRLELLKEAIPGVSRIGVLGGLTTDYESAARALKVQILSLEVRGPNPDFEGAFQVATSGRVSALTVDTQGVTISHRKLIADLAIKNRIPSMCERSDYVEVGCLMSYSADEAESFRRAAYYVDKILKGAKPADLPVEQPTKFEFIINLKTAKQIGLTIPPNVLVRADRVIK
jgi:putative ABC transport system substrate-binding protein